MAVCFFLGDNLLDSATAIKLLLSSYTLQSTSGFGRCKSKRKDNYFTNTIKGMTLRITWINVMYPDYFAIKEIFVCNLLRHNTGHPAYVITYPDVTCHLLYDQNLLETIGRKSWHLHNTQCIFISIL